MKIIKIGNINLMFLNAIMVQKEYQEIKSLIISTYILVCAVFCSFYF